MATTHFSHPGEILERRFLKPLGMSRSQLADAIGVDRARVNQIVRGERAVTADTALRLARFFGTSAQFWLNLQTHYDLETQSGGLKDELDRIQPLSAAS